MKIQYIFLLFTLLGFNSSGNEGVDIYDEVRAKQWVANNVNISGKQGYDSKVVKELDGINYKRHSFDTHYGYIKKLSTAKDIKQFLRTNPIQTSTVRSDARGGADDVQTRTISGDAYTNKALFPDSNPIKK